MRRSSLQVFQSGVNKVVMVNRMAGLELNTEESRKIRGEWRRRASALGPDDLSSLADLAAVHEEPVAPTPDTLRKGFMRRASTRELTPLMEAKDAKVSKEEPAVTAGNWILPAAMTFGMGVSSAIPYVLLLAIDPGSPLFLAFVTHCFFVIVNLPKLRKIVLERKLPVKYHCAIVAMNLTYNILRSDAFVRLPTAACMLLMNSQLVIGLIVNFFVFRARYSKTQLVASAVVTTGVLWAGISTMGASQAKESTVGSMIIGVVELICALTALTMMSVVVKIGFNRYGECVEEQIFYQHLGSLPVFYLMGSQWALIGPRIESWFTNFSPWICFLLLFNTSSTFAHNWFQGLFAGRVPNMLIFQLVDIVKKFANLVVSAMLKAPPFPPMGFWGGALMLVAGTVQFLSASDSPKDSKEADKKDQDEPVEENDEDDDDSDEDDDDDDDDDDKKD